MIDAQEMQERHARWLARYGEMAMSLAEQLHDDAMAAETPEERRKAAAAFHRVARAGRQSMALEARFLREAERAAREASDEARQDRETRVKARKRSIHNALTRLIWDEHEGARAMELILDLGERLHELGDAPEFLDEPVEVQVAALAKALGLPPPQFEGSGQPAAGAAAQPIAPPYRASG